MNLHTVSGTIENLRIVEAQQNIVFGPHMQEAAGISALVFAAAGMGGAAVGTSMNADAAEDVNLYLYGCLPDSKSNLLECCEEVGC